MSAKSKNCHPPEEHYFSGAGEPSHGLSQCPDGLVWMSPSGGTALEKGSACTTRSRQVLRICLNDVDVPCGALVN